MRARRARSRPGHADDTAAKGAQTGWALGQRARLAGGEVAWDRFGSGSPVVLVHGTPSWSYGWRAVAPGLAYDHAVFVLDLIGYGDSSKDVGQDTSVKAQSRALAQLLDRWQLERPALVGHDIGAAIVLRTHLIEQRPASRIVLIDGALFRPWNTPATLHMKRHLDAYATMPAPIYERVVAAHVATATHHPMPQHVLDAYLRPWRGPDGQAAYFHKIAQWDDDHLAETETALSRIDIPVLVLWGAEDGWLPASLARRFENEIETARSVVIPDAGHFVMDDDPRSVIRELRLFLGSAPESAR